jgi:GT2 family glycosyltransferase
MISVLVVNHNGERWIERCLSSLGVPPPAGVQVVVVDNGSTDGSPELVAVRFPHARLLRMGHNAGFAVANNVAAACADGQALLLLNNDAWLGAGALDLMGQRLDADSRIGLVAPRLVSLDGRPQFVWSPDRSLLGAAVQRFRNRFEGQWWNHNLLPPLLRLVLGRGWYTGACVLVRRRAFDEIGGFDPGFFLYHEDTDLCLRLRRAGWRLASQPKATVVHAGGLRPVDERTELHYRQSQLYFYAKHRPRWEEELVWKHVVKLYESHPEGAVAGWLRRGGAAQRPVEDAIEVLEGLLGRSDLPSATRDVARRQLDMLRREDLVDEAADG